MGSRSESVKPQSEDFFPQTAQIIRENMESKVNRETIDDSDAINGAFFYNDDEE